MSDEIFYECMRHDFIMCIIPDFNRYLYAYCRSNNVLHDEAFKHKIVQETYKQYTLETNQKGGGSG